jgi:formylglycine-generating enzyme required for sulfatase activity
VSIIQCFWASQDFNPVHADETKFGGQRALLLGINDFAAVTDFRPCCADRQSPRFFGGNDITLPRRFVLADKFARVNFQPPVARSEPHRPADISTALGGLDEPTRIELLPQGVEPVLRNSVGMKLKLIPAGEFTMGSSETRDQLDEHFELWEEFDPSKSRPFYLGMYEVTTGEFTRFVEATGYKTEGERDGQGGGGWNVRKQFVEVREHEGGSHSHLHHAEQRDDSHHSDVHEDSLEAHRPVYTWRSWGVKQSDRSPVVNVSWNDAVKFCQWLSEQEGATCRLPNEAEWEYACRAGTTTRFFNGDDPESLPQVGNVADGTYRAKFNSKYAIRARDGWLFTAPVGQYKANDFGIYDMIGNVGEWCSDRVGDNRVIRGGSWRSRIVHCRCASRYNDHPTCRLCGVGFRVVRELSPAAEASSK